MKKQSKLTIDKIRFFETNFLKEFDNNEILYWPPIKTLLCRSCSLPEARDESRPKFKFSLLLTLFYSLITLLRVCIFDRKSKDIIFGAASRAFIKNGFVVDELSPEGKCKGAIKLYYSNKPFTLSFKGYLRQRVIIENLVVRLFNIMSKLKVRKASNIIGKSKFLQALTEYFKDDLDESRIIRLVRGIEIDRLTYQLLLSLLNVRRVYLVSAYTKVPIVLACHDLGLAVTEYQHGLLSPFHASYDYSHVNSKECITMHKALPDYMVVSNQYWFNQMMRSKYTGNVSVSNKRPFSPSEHKEHLLKYFLITGQGICYEETKKFITNMLEVFPDISVLYRPHPREYDVVSKLSFSAPNSRFLIADRSFDVSTKNLISQSLAHLSIYSSCHFEALELLGETYVLDWIDNNIMSDGFEENSVFFVKNTEDFYKAFNLK